MENDFWYLGSSLDPRNGEMIAYFPIKIEYCMELWIQWEFLLVLPGANYIPIYLHLCDLEVSLMAESWISEQISCWNFHFVRSIHVFKGIDPSKNNSYAANPLWNQTKHPVKQNYRLIVSSIIHLIILSFFLIPQVNHPPQQLHRLQSRHQNVFMVI